MTDEVRQEGYLTEVQGAESPATSPVILVQFPPVWGRNFSPFTLKLETWLRLARVPYTVRFQRNPSFSPKGKLPYIIDRGRRVGDSGLIIEHLKRSRLIDPDAWLNARQLAESLTLQRTFEDHLYHALVYARWVDPEGWLSMTKVVSATFPAPFDRVVGPLLRRKITSRLREQGHARHSAREIYAMAREDLAAASIMLGSRRFFMGEQTSTIDAVAFGFLSNILLVPMETELRRIADDFPNLRRFCEQMDLGLERASLHAEANPVHTPVGA
ncbi:MAG TPA: glutathione S-transferase family protein [Geminicoccus sp.]|uniref:glutathione S-transferase family protein n=1 Tax=Geminicoccus sp. TaxID=2024832 RepID=UPI002E35662B|nr:glutathione S-transferase family protein [Geminicoccus sp.]HEX2528735.1 glutathione S-transferase family protein [Geminicoccus sp.]